MPLIQNQFGGTFGGPIFKDKTFFFFGFEREVLKTGTLVTNTVPTPSELAGDFTAPGLPAIYDHSQPGDPQFQCNGVLNVICPNRLDSSALALFGKSYPSPKQSGITNNYITQMATGGINAQYNARVDHRFSEKNTLFARYAYWKADRTPTTRGGPTLRVRAILVSTLSRQYLETRTPSIPRRFWIYGSPICVFSNTSFRTAKALTSLNSVPVGQVLPVSLWRQRIIRQ